MEKIKNTLVILSYDEKEALEKLIPKIPLSAFDEVFAIDPGSTDGTLDVYNEHNIKYFIQKQEGRGNAFIEAKSIAKGDNIVFFSADGNEDPADLPKMIKYFDEGYDLVIGGRFVLKGSESDDSDDFFKIRKYGNIAYSLLVRLFWGAKVWDSINGFRGLKKESMERMHLDAPKHEIELQSTIRAAKLKMKIKEFPTHELKRLGGERKASAGTSTLAWRIGKFLLSEIFICNKF